VVVLDNDNGATATLPLGTDTEPVVSDGGRTTSSRTTLPLVNRSTDGRSGSDVEDMRRLSRSAAEQRARARLSASTASTVPASTPSPGRAATDGNTLDSVFPCGVVLTNHIFFSSTAAIANGTTTTIGNSSATTATHSARLDGMAATHRRHGQRLPARVAA